MKHWTHLLKLMAVMGLVTVLLAGCSAKTADGAETAQASGETAQASEASQAADGGDITHEPESAPDFELKNLEGETVTLSSYEGQYVLINFWATWCQYCDKEMPDLMAFQEKHKDEVTVLAINVKEDQKTIEQYLKKKNLDLTVLMDQDGKIAESYLVSAFPTTFLIDRAGKVIGYIPGMMTAEDMEASFKYLKDNDTSK